MFDQLQFFLNLNYITEIFQSGFKSAHSTETALLRVLNDILLATDSVVLVLLDLSAAFDTVDHSILITRLESFVGLKGMVLKWFQSFLSDRIFFVKLGDFPSSAPLTCGLPQGSILARSLFFPVHASSGFHSKKAWGVFSFHFYADDTQIYLPIKRSDPSALSTLLRCLEEVKHWLTQKKKFTLNEDKTEVIVFSYTDHSQATSLDLGSLLPFRSSRV